MKNSKIFLSIAVLFVSNLFFGQQKDSTSTEINKIEEKAGDKKPLYIVDGQVTNDKDFQALDTKNIAAIEILKETTSTSAYGLKGSHGVIVVTTKDAETKKDKRKKE